MEALVVVLFVVTLVWLLSKILREQDREIEREVVALEKLVYLSREEIETLEAVADRIDTFGHKSDAAMLRNMVVSG
jgi:hypothetical protein